MLESCEIYVKPHVAFNLIDVVLEGHSGYAARGRHVLPAGGRCPRAAQNIYNRMLEGNQLVSNHEGHEGQDT